MKGCLKWIGVGFLVLFGLAVLGAAMSGGTDTGPQTLEEVAQQTSAESTERPKPTERPRPTPTPTEIPPGLSKENPAPAGQLYEVGDWAIGVFNENYRGGEALQLLKAENMFNEDPRPGSEWLIIGVKGVYLGEGTGTLSPGSFRVTGSSKQIHEQEFVVLSRALELQEVYPEGEVEGLLAFQIKEGEEDLVVIYDAGFLSDAFYISIP